MLLNLKENVPNCNLDKFVHYVTKIRYIECKRYVKKRGISVTLHLQRLDALFRAHKCDATLDTQKGWRHTQHHS